MTSYAVYYMLCPSGVARNFNWGTSSPSSPLPFPLLSLPFPSHPPFAPLYLPMLSLFPFPRLPLEVRPLKIQLEGLGECCELPQWDLRQSPSRNQIWCILALKDEIWWQQF